MQKDLYARPAKIVRTFVGFIGLAQFDAKLHTLILLLFPHRTPCFCLRLRQSAIIAINSLFVGLPLMFDTV